MKVSKADVEPIVDHCAEIRELCGTEGMTLAHATLTKTTPHMHKIMDEMYYVTKGKGRMILGDEEFDVNEGDAILIPKNTMHFIETINDEPMELVVVTNPSYNHEDVYF